MNNFREAREMLNLSQKEVAADLGVSCPTVSEWEKGKKTPSIENITKLAEEYDRSINYLLGIPDNNFFDSFYMRAIRSFCEKVDIDYRKVENLYINNPEYIARYKAKKPMKITERVELKKIFGGVEPEAAICLGCSMYDNADDYSEFYVQHYNDDPKLWGLMTRINILSNDKKDKLRTAIEGMLDVYENDSSNPLSAESYDSKFSETKDA